MCFTIVSVCVWNRRNQFIETKIKRIYIIILLQNLFGGDGFSLLKRKPYIPPLLTTLSNFEQICRPVWERLTNGHLKTVQGGTSLYVNVFYSWNQSRREFKPPGFEHSYAMHSHMQIQACSQVGCFSGADGVTHQPTIVGFCGKAHRGWGKGLSRVSKKKKRTVPPTASSAFSASRSSSAKEGQGVFVILALSKWIGSVNTLC